jgi:hypothetical protein
MDRAGQGSYFHIHVRLADAGTGGLGSRRALMVGADMLSSLQLWRDRRGRLSALRMATLALLLLPVALAVTAGFT